MSLTWLTLSLLHAGYEERHCLSTQVYLSPCKYIGVYFCDPKMFLIAGVYINSTEAKLNLFVSTAPVWGTTSDITA